MKGEDNEDLMNGMADEPTGTAKQQEAFDPVLRQALHDLCQPLMALECLLYVNREPIPGESLDAGRLRNVMDEGLVECGRMLALIRIMQDRLNR